MNNLVFGTGLIGGFVGGGLINAGINTVFMGRKKHRTAMQAGLTISALSGHKVSVSPPVFLDAASAERFDVIWLTVKCTAIESSVAQLKQLTKPSTIIVCCQNGIGTDAIIKEGFPNNPVVSAVVGFNVAEQNGDHLHRSTDGSLVIEAHPVLDDYARRLNSAILPVYSTNNIEAERWAKLQLNLANPVNALADIPTKAMTEDPDYRKVISALMRELLSVTKAMKLSLPKLKAVPARSLPLILNLPNFIYLKLAQKTLAIDPTARVSMWWDLSQGRKSEIEFLNQAIVEQGKELGIDCVYNERIVKLIQKVERNELEIGLTGTELQNLLGISS